MKAKVLFLLSESKGKHPKLKQKKVNDFPMSVLQHLGKINKMSYGQ